MNTNVFSLKLTKLGGFLKEMLVWYILAHYVPCVHLMKLLCTKFVGTYPSYLCAKKKFVVVVVFEKKRFEVKVDNVYTYAYHIQEVMTKRQKKKFYCPKNILCTKL
jgi:hypothetical protein